jgi:hypothetical protein
MRKYAITTKQPVAKVSEGHQPDIRRGSPQDTNLWEIWIARAPGADTTWWQSRALP